MTPAPGRRSPLSPREGWLSDGHLVLRFRPTRWESRVQRLEITTGELLPDEAIPLLKSRRELEPGRGPEALEREAKGGLEAMHSPVVTSPMAQVREEDHPQAPYRLPIGVH